MEKNLYKTDSIRDLGEFDLCQLPEKVKLLSDSDWNQKEDFDLNYNKGRGALKQVKHLTLRFINRKTEPYQYLEGKRWKNWKEMLLPLMTNIVSPYGYENPVFPKVMFANLPAGSFIPPHIDGNERGYVPHKIHVPIETNEKSYFFIENKRYQLEVGKAYEVNNGLSHAVANKGVTDRIHLIFECLDYDIQPKSTQNRMKSLR